MEADEKRLDARLQAVENNQNEETKLTDRFMGSVLRELRTLVEAVDNMRLHTHQPAQSSLASGKVRGKTTQVEDNPHMDPEVELSKIFSSLLECLRKLRNKGFVPDFILDVGASNGCWSHKVSLIFPSARYILVEPLSSHYQANFEHDYLQLHPEFELEECAVSNKRGKLQLNMASDAFSSSVFALPDEMHRGTIEVPLTTLDDLAEKRGLHGRGLLKLDIQFAEHLALEGARKLLSQVDVVVIELAMYRFYPQVKVFEEMLAFMGQYGFWYFDDVGEYRDSEGILRTKDGLFVRKDLFA